MSLLRKVTDAINAAGSGSLDTLQLVLPGYTRDQLHSAVQNASRRKLILLAVRGKSRGRHKGRYPATYVPYREPEPPGKMGRYRQTVCGSGVAVPRRARLILGVSDDRLDSQV